MWSAPIILCLNIGPKVDDCKLAQHFGANASGTPNPTTGSLKSTLIITQNKPQYQQHRARALPASGPNTPRRRASTSGIHCSVLNSEAPGPPDPGPNTGTPCHPAPFCRSHVSELLTHRQRLGSPRHWSTTQSGTAVSRTNQGPSSPAPRTDPQTGKGAPTTIDRKRAVQQGTSRNRPQSITQNTGRPPRTPRASASSSTVTNRPPSRGQNIKHNHERKENN